MRCGASYTEVVNILIASATPQDAAFFREALPGHHVTTIPEDPSAGWSEVEALAVVHGIPLFAETLAGMPSLRLIVTRSTGFDHIDVAYARERGIHVCNVPEYGSVTVAEFTFGLILSLLRRIPQAVASTKSGVFSIKGLTGEDLEGKTLGIVGLGKIGRNVAKMASGFSMEVLANDAFKPDSTPLDELLQRSDVVALCCPLTDQTRHLINAESLAKMKPTAYLLNTARGPVVDSVALLAALENGQLAGAALDVIEGEEAFRTGLEDHFTAVNKTLAIHPSVLMTPHLAFDSKEAVQRIRQTTADILLAFAEGKVLNPVPN